MLTVRSEIGPATPLTALSVVAKNNCTHEQKKCAAGVTEEQVLLSA